MPVMLQAIDSTQPEASTSTTPRSQKICSICNICDSIYTCPGCSIQTCSLPCSTSHKTGTGCTGQRNKAAYVPMNKYGWGTMMGDYVFLEDVARRIGDWGNEIVKGGYGTQAPNALGRSGVSRGRGADTRGRGRGKGRAIGHTKRDVLKMQLEVRDIDMDVLPVGMERRSLNQSYWDPKSHVAFLTIEFKIYPPRDPLTPSSQPPDPPFIVLTHRNKIDTPLLNLARQATTERALSKKHTTAHEWIKHFLLPDPDDPDSFTPPHFVMAARMNPRAAVLQKAQHRTAYYRFDSSQPLLVLLRHTHFVEFPTIEIWEEFTGTVVDVQGAVTELPMDDEPKTKRRKLSTKAGKQAMKGLLGGYGSDDSDLEEAKQGIPSGLALLGGYTGSDEEGRDDEAGEDEDVFGESDEVEVELDPASLLELMRHAHGDERWMETIQADEEVDWGASEDEEKT